MAIDFNSWTTYLQAGLAAVLTWIVRTLIQQGQSQVKLQTIVEYYVERESRDAAKRLDIPNPAPPEIRALLQKHIQGETLNDDERPLLVTWLHEAGNNPLTNSSERAAALKLLTGIATMKKFRPKRRWRDLLFFAKPNE